MFEGEKGEPTRDGYVFDKYTYKDNDTKLIKNGVYASSLDESHDYTIVAHFRLPVVTFNMCADDLESTKESITEANGTIAEPEVPTLDGYRFDGWFTSEDYTQKYDFSTPVTSDITLYAKWTAIVTHTVAFDDGIEGNEEIPSQTIDDGGVATKPDDPTREGYTFVGWSDQSGALYDFTDPVTSDLTLTAKWEKDPVVTFEYNDGKTEAVTVSVKSGSKVSCPERDEREGYTFLGWYTEEGVEYDFDAPVTGDITLHGEWHVNLTATFYNEISYADTGDVEPAFTYDNLKYNKSFPTPGSPSVPEGYDSDLYVFQGWYTDPSLADEYRYDFNSMVTDDLTLYAKWVHVPVINYYVDGDADKPYETVNGEIGKHAMQPQTAPEREGYTFDGTWYTDPEYKNKYHFTMSPALEGNEVLNLYAHWTVNTYTVTFNDGIDGTADDTQTVEYNTAVAEPAAPSREGYTFAGWYTDEKCTEKYDFSTPVTSDLTLYAKWEKSGGTQEPGGDDQKPGGDTQEPGGDEQNPGGDTQKPSGDDQKPSGDTQKPSGDTQKPSGDTQKPSGDTQKPSGDTQKPSGDTQKPSGDTQKPSGDSQVETVTMYRLYNRFTGEHLYTSQVNERDELVKVGWTYEHVAWTSPKKSSTPVYRLYNPYVAGGDHHYTTDANEYRELQRLGWRGEGVYWYSDDDKTVPVYREYNPYATTGTHNFTVDRNEHDTLVSLGWKNEGIAWYATSAK